MSKRKTTGFGLVLHVLVTLMYPSFMIGQLTIIDMNFKTDIDSTTMVINDCEGGVVFGPNSSGSQFIISDAEGAACDSCANSPNLYFGNNSSSFTTKKIDISAYCNVVVEVAFKLNSTTFESPDCKADLGCAGYDDLSFEYTLDGFSKTFYDPDLGCMTRSDSIFTGTGSSGILDGNTLEITVYGGTSAKTEIIRITQIELRGIPKSDIELSSFNPLCDTAAVLILPAIQDGIRGAWSGSGLDEGTNEFDPQGLNGMVTLTFNPDSGQCANSNSANIQIKSTAIPRFSFDTVICENASPIDLPMLSDNGISGSWDIGNRFDPTGQGGDRIPIIFIPNADECVSNTSIFINATTVPVISSVATNSPNCGMENGTIFINASSDKNLEYALDNGNFQSENSFSNLAANSYLLRVRDENNCEIQQRFMLNDLSAPSIDSIKIEDAACGADNGSIQIEASGGQGALSYSLDGNRFQSNSFFPALAEGSYPIQIKDETGCISTQLVDIHSSGIIALECLEGQSASTVGANDGIGLLTISGGTAPYSVNLSGAGMSSSQVVEESGELGLAQLPAANYMITVEDSANCTTSCSLEITQATTCNSITVSIDTMLCQDEFIVVNGTRYDQNKPTGIELVAGENTCDSLYQIQISSFELDLYVLASPCTDEPASSIVLERIIDPGETFLYQIDSGGFQLLPEWPFIFSNIAPGVHLLNFENEQGCRFDTILEVPVLEEYRIESGPTIKIKLGEQVQLNPSPNFTPTQINWAPSTSLSCTDCLNPIAAPEKTTIYTLQLSDAQGCSVETEIVVYVEKIRRVYLPTAFSPNGDGKNDHFLVSAGEEVVIIHLLQIFDRWGNLVFAHKDFLPDDPSSSWDGRYRDKALNPEVFIYHTEIEFSDGEILSFKGNVTLLGN